MSGFRILFYRPMHYFLFFFFIRQTLPSVTVATRASTAGRSFISLRRGKRERCVSFSCEVAFDVRTFDTGKPQRSKCVRCNDIARTIMCRKQRCSNGSRVSLDSDPDPGGGYVSPARATPRF